MTSTLSTLVNHQVRLASRPVGLPTRRELAVHRGARGRARRGRRAGEDAGAVAGPGHARLDERRQELHPAGGHRRGHARRRRGRGPGLAPPGLRRRRPRQRRPRRAGIFRVAGDQIRRSGLAKIDLRLGTLTQWLNVLGMPGMTAYFGLMDVGQPQPGETLVVSGAAGAVGQTVGQLAKIKGCRVVGIAGGPAKCEWVVRELGFDACIDYKARRRPAPRAGTRQGGPEAALPERRRHLFRQCRRRHPRHRAGAHDRKRAHRHLRRHQPVQQHRRRCRGRRTT